MPPAQSSPPPPPATTEHRALVPRRLPARPTSGASIPGELTAWCPHHRELAAVADGLSLLMPHLEPLALRTVREATTRLGERDAALRRRASGWVRQEAAHQREHRRHNEALLAASPALRRLDRLTARSTALVARRSLRARLAFTCGFEAMAFAVARWFAPRVDELFLGADPAVATLFVWHLAEEVEHRDVAHDVQVAALEATQGAPRRSSRWRGVGSRFLGGVAALAVVAPLTLVGAVVLLGHDRRLHLPVTWFRLVRWALSFTVGALGAVAVLALPGHHPDQLAAPPWFPDYLAATDPDGVAARWDPPDVTGALVAPAPTPRTSGSPDAQANSVSKGPATS